MSFLGTVRSIGEALGIWQPSSDTIGCSLGKVIFRETHRSARIVNSRRRAEAFTPRTTAMLAELFPALDVGRIRVKKRCRLPANRFMEEGSIYAMTFGYTIYWRDPDLDEDDEVDLVKLIHEVVHVDQFRRFGSEKAFACAYGKGYIAGGGEVPDRISTPTAYHRNPLEAEAYQFDNRFRDANGRAARDLLPLGPP